VPVRILFLADTHLGFDLPERPRVDRRRRGPDFFANFVRALEPASGIDRMRARRGLDEERLLCSGPGRLCQALAITGGHDGLALDRAPFDLRAREEAPEVVRGPRVGISRAAELPWRYGLAGSRYLSRALRAPG
jgi:DNA-3-methyladenine glycosylase